ncbi:MAG: leucine--tRNA ligase, partial [Candidatus Melainabacteria bacterium]|nr:leucine--tRNA ligase [Candidatus Melainabacteria bacterium]
TSVVQRLMDQWFLKITAFADLLLDDLNLLAGWPERVKIMQRNWIGKSEGAELYFTVEGQPSKTIAVFTTRPDTVFGVSYLVLAPENPLVQELTTRECSGSVKDYIEQAIHKTELERLVTEKVKTGVFIGSNVINPFNGAIVPIWVSDYVLMSYGTGAVMGVPAHDERDFEFAKAFKLPVKEVISPTGQPSTKLLAAYLEPGVMIHSGQFDGLASNTAKQQIIDWAVKNQAGSPATQYRLRDWLISRQRYWGCPIPLIHCQRCGVVPVSENELPIELPIAGVELTGFGSSPLARQESWVNVTCSQCGTAARRETDTMDTFIDSSWYFLRYTDAENCQTPFSLDKVNYWMPIDQYVGGIEHAILHLLYARFFTKALSALGLVNCHEPFANLLSQGMVTKYSPTSGRTEKMSKSRGNVVGTTDFFKRYGADAARLFTLFAAPPAQELEWSEEGAIGQFRFLGRLWRLVTDFVDKGLMEPEPIIDNTTHLDLSGKLLLRLTHKTIKAVTKDLSPECYGFNTAIARSMELVNALYKYLAEKTVSNKLVLSQSEKNLVSWSIKNLLLLLAPMAPHITEELWHRSGCAKNLNDSIHISPWPQYEDLLTLDEQIELVLQVNGKVVSKVTAARGLTQMQAQQLALDDSKIQGKINGQSVHKIIVVPDKLVNVVI